MKNQSLDLPVVAAISEGIASEPVPRSLENRVKKRLLVAIASESLSLHTTQFEQAGQWLAMSPLISCKVLHQTPEFASYLLKLSPGAVLPAHYHPIDEECLVLEGELSIGNELVLKKGDFHLAAKGVLHAEITSSSGALLYLRGAVPELSHFI